MPLIQPTIIKSADGLLHLYRVVALEHALGQGGTFFPRWLPDLAYGYGFPLFVYYAPLAYYITLALSLSGLKTLAAFNTAFVLALVLAGTGTYLFVKDLFGPRAGVLAGVAYVYAPFQLANALARGSLPAAWAMALFPLVFWLMGRLIKQSLVESRPSSPILPLSALVFGAALLTHNTLSLLFVPLLGLYVGLTLLGIFFLGRTSRARTDFGRAAVRVGLALMLGFGVAAFFLLPAIVEQRFAQVQRVITSPDFDFRFNFVSLDQLLALPQPANTGLLNPDFPLTLGLAQVGLAGLGLSLLTISGFRALAHSFRNGASLSPDLAEGMPQVQRRTEIEPTASSPESALPISYLPITIFAVISLISAMLMMLPVSTAVWELLPLLAFVQFPHRLLGPIALVLAVMAGAAIALLPARLSFAVALSGIVLLIVTSIPQLYPRYLAQAPAEPTVLDMMDYEHASGTIGTTSFGEYLPIWVKQVPGESPLESLYQSGLAVERLDPAYLPPAAEVEVASYGFNQAELIIRSPEAFQAIFHTFYFPGWQALIDGEATLIAPVSERGLIGVDVPAGRHRLQLYFSETPLRQAANGVTIIILMLLLAWLVVSYVYQAHGSTGNSVAPETRTAPRQGFHRSQRLILTGLALALIAVKLLYLDRYDNPLKRTFDGTAVTSADVSGVVNFGDQINLLGYDLGQTTVQAGESFELSAYWQARQPPAVNYSALAQLIDDERHLYAGQDNLHPGTLQTTLWQPWGYVRDSHTVPVPAGTPPGDYLLVTGLYDPKTWARLQIKGDQAVPWSDVFTIPVAVTKPPHRPTVPDLGLSWPIDADVGPDLRLLGATPERDTTPRNDFLRVAIFWEARQPPARDYQVSLRVVAVDGTTVKQETTRPSYNRYPTRLWAEGERVRDNHELWIPADFPAGQYRLQVQLLDEAGQPVGGWIELGSIAITE